MPPAPERITFAPGQTSAVRSGVVAEGVDKQYVFWAQAGQVARILLASLPAATKISRRGVSDGVLYKSAAIQREVVVPATALTGLSDYDFYVAGGKLHA